MRLYNAKFLDYTTYNQNEYAASAANYQDSYIIKGLYFKNSTTLSSGQIFLNGWHLTFIDDFSANRTEGNYIYITLTSTVGAKEESLYETIYTQGKLDAKVSQGTSLPTSAYPLYRYVGGSWQLLSNGRINTINGKKADLEHKIILDGNSINVIDPGTGAVALLNNTLDNMQDLIETLTTGGLTEATADNKYKTIVELHRSSITNDELIGLTFAQLLAKVRAAYPTQHHTVVTGAYMLGYEEIPFICQNLITDIYGTSDNLSNYTFTLNAPLGLAHVYNGGSTLTISGNGGKTKWEFTVDNYIQNGVYLVENAGAFAAANTTGGSANFLSDVSTEGNLTVENTTTTTDLVWGITQNSLSANGKYMTVPSDFTIQMNNTSGSQLVKFDQKVRIGNELRVGDNINMFADGSVKMKKIGIRQIEFENSTGTNGSKALVLNHNNGALAGVLEWNRKTTYSNGCFFYMTTQSTGKNFCGIRAIENTRVYNYGTDKYLMEASTYLSREVDVLTQLSIMQGELDEKEARIKLLELQMQAIINNTDIPTTLPETRMTNASNNVFEKMLENTKKELEEENYINSKMALETQISNLKADLVAVNVKRNVPATTLNYKNVLEEAEKKLADLESAHKGA